jgi:hypothetical protein
MSYSVCPICGGMLEGHAGSPCMNPTCMNSRRVRERATPRYVAPLTGQVTSERPDPALDRKRRQKRKAQRAARRRNRRSR